MELIDKNEFKEHLKVLKPEGYENSVLGFVTIRELDNFNVVDAVPVVHGHWEIAIGYDPRRVVECSVCNRMNFEPSNYCPYCGAKMDEEVPG